MTAEASRSARPQEGAVPAARASVAGSVLFLAALFLTGLTLGGARSAEVARHAAVGVGLGMVLSAACDARAGGWRNLIRADVCAILALYFLTLFEFLFPQGDFDLLAPVASTRMAVQACLWGFAGLAAGRHLVNLRRHPLRNLFTQPVPGGWMLALFWGCFFSGFFYMLQSVSFNPVALVDNFLGPRFSQPWQRGRLGDWRALLYEMVMLLYIVPPLAGILLARRQRYGKVALAGVLAGFLFTLFYAFCTGTRNLFLTYLVTFLIGYGFGLPARRGAGFLVLCAVAGVVTLGATVFMVEFREIGLRNYLRGRYSPFETREQSLFVDNNLYAITRLVEVFPKPRPYLGWEVPWLALVRPVPRALWPGKPEGLSVSIEDAVGAEGWTVAASFIGEAYMCAGHMGVLLIGLLLGALTGWWSRLAAPDNSDLGILIYASGFFAAVISMRSIYVFTTAALPTLASILFAWVLVRIVRRRLQWRMRLLRRPTPGRAPRGLREGRR